MSTKKAAATSFIRCPPLVGGIYTVPPGEHHNWIFASEGLYSLCVNCNHRRHYNFVLCTIVAAKLQNFLHLSKDFLNFVRKLVDYALSLTAPSKKRPPFLVDILSHLFLASFLIKRISFRLTKDFYLITII